MTKHTSLPWRIDKGWIYAGTTRIVAIEDVLPVAYKEEEKANAEFIVRACNSHEELLEACKALLALAEGHPYEAPETTIKWTNQAIAKATGGQDAIR